jgi:hypothetical protein
MRRFTSPLKNVTVATPCPADWDGMIGSERVKFCGQCELNVYNLSAMSTREAESLIAGAEGRLCVRFYRRKDGSIITQDCPVGLRALKRRASRIKRAVASSVLGFLAGVGVNIGFGKVETPLLGAETLWRRPERTMGVIALQPPLNDQRPIEVSGTFDRHRPPTTQGRVLKRGSRR